MVKSDPFLIQNIFKKHQSYLSSHDPLIDTEHSDDKDIRRQLRYQYYAANKLRASFSRCSNVVKNIAYFFVLVYAHVCIIIMV